MIFGVTGIILLNNYIPAVLQAYLDILEINSNLLEGIARLDWRVLALAGVVLSIAVTLVSQGLSSLRKAKD